jgi:hypothetical protein
MKKIYADLKLWLLMTVLVFVTGCLTRGVENCQCNQLTEKAVAPDTNNLGSKTDPLYTWVNSRSAIDDSLSTGLARGTKVENKNIDYKNIASYCIAQSERIRSYKTRLFMKDLGSKKENNVGIEWYMAYEWPDRFLVDQTSLTEHVADRWITCGKNHYCQMGIWIEDKNGEWRAETNKFLTFEKYIKTMKANAIESAETYRSGDLEFVVLRYTSKDLRAFNVDTEESNNMSCKVEIWLDRDSKIIAASTIIKDGKKAVELRQLFADYGYFWKFDIKKPINKCQCKSVSKN